MPAGAGDNQRLHALPEGSSSRQLILDTARRLFQQHGYDATSLRQIAEAVGMTKAAVYYHYPAKENLLLELIRPMLDALGDLVTHLRSDDADGEEVDVLALYLDLFLAHMPAVALMARDPATLNHPDVGPRIRTLVEAIGRQVAGPDAGTERTVRAACALGVIHGASALEPDVVARSRDVVLSAARATLGDKP
jgi:AcrR family transcriptional regulator